MATEAAVRREAEHKRIEVLFSESGIKPEESWINLRVSDVGNDNSTWCDSSEGRLFEFDTIETLAAVVASLTAQLGEGSDPYETLSVDISHMKRTWPATKRHGVVHLTAFGTGSYLCIGPNKKKK
jgi:hypothetical protein